MTGPNRPHSSLRPQAHTHIQWASCTLRQSRRETLLSLPGKSRARSQGALRNAPSEESTGDSFLWDTYCRLPFGAGRPLSWNVENQGWFLCRNSVWEGTGNAGYVQRLRTPSQKVVLGPLAALISSLGKLPPEGSHSAFCVLLKARAPTHVLVAHSILGALHPKWSGPTTSEWHQEDRKDNAH